MDETYMQKNLRMLGNLGDRLKMKGLEHLEMQYWRIMSCIWNPVSKPPCKSAMFKSSWSQVLT